MKTSIVVLVLSCCTFLLVSPASAATSPQVVTKQLASATAPTEVAKGGFDPYVAQGDLNTKAIPVCCCSAWNFNCEDIPVTSPHSFTSDQTVVGSSPRQVHREGPIEEIAVNEEQVAYALCQADSGNAPARCLSPARGVGGDVLRREEGGTLVLSHGRNSFHTCS